MIFCKKLKRTALLALISLPLAVVAQSSTYNEANYGFVKQELDSNGRYLQAYKQSSGNHRLLKVYLDSACTDLLSKTFYNDSTTDGPITIYQKGKVILKGAYKNGNWDGERLTYQRDVLMQKAYYNSGVKTGIWEEYSLQGTLKRRITFDASGNVSTDVRY